MVCFWWGDGARARLARGPKASNRLRKGCHAQSERTNRCGKRCQTDFVAQKAREACLPTRFVRKTVREEWLPTTFLRDMACVAPLPTTFLRDMACVAPLPARNRQNPAVRTGTGVSFWRGLAAIAEPPQVGLDGLFQRGGLRELGV